MSSYWKDEPIYYDFGGKTLIADYIKSGYSYDPDSRQIGLTIQFREMTPNEEEDCKKYKGDLILEAVSASLAEPFAKCVSKEIRERLTDE